MNHESISFDMGDLLASGSQGQVFTATLTPSQTPIVAKVVQFRGSKRVKAAFREEAALTELAQGHDNIVRVHGSHTGASFGLLLLERADIDLLDYATSADMTSEDIKDIFAGVCGAVQHIHQLGIAHRDIKPENILMSGGVPLLADFGAAVDVTDDNHICFDKAGTEMYAAPEVLRKDNYKGYDPIKADMWSMGILLHVLLTGCWPFCTPEDIQLGFVEVDEQVTDESALLLLQSLLSRNPAMRPTISEVLASDFLAAPVSEMAEITEEEAEEAEEEEAKEEEDVEETRKESPRCNSIAVMTPMRASNSEQQLQRKAKHTFSSLAQFRLRKAQLASALRKSKLVSFKLLNRLLPL